MNQIGLKINSDLQNWFNDHKLMKWVDEGEINMGTLKQEAQAYESQSTRNIADLPQVDVDFNLEERSGTNKQGEVFEYKVIVVGKNEYRVPVTVLKDLKMILENNPNLKKFKVKKTGEGKSTDYTVIPLV